MSRIPPPAYYEAPLMHSPYEVTEGAVGKFLTLNAYQGLNPFVVQGRLDNYRLRLPFLYELVQKGHALKKSLLVIINR